MGFGVSIPTRMHLGCKRRRHFALVVTVRNRSRNPVKLVPARADQSWAEIGMISRVAVQFRLAPPPPTADLLVAGMRRWSRSRATPVERAAVAFGGRTKEFDGWVSIGEGGCRPRLAPL